MNFFGKNIDPVVLQKISKMIDSGKGMELKKQLQNVDKEALINMFSKLNISQKDISDVSERIKNLSQDELLNEISKKWGDGR